MFEKELAEKLKRIFDLKKVNYDSPSDSKEQECIFVNIQSSKSHIRDKRFAGKVIGKITVFGSKDKLPYGYFIKGISKAKNEDTKDFFFYDFEENQGPNENISERSANFVYLFDMQYDPNLGEITELITTLTVGA